MAPFIAKPPNCVALKPDKEPPNEPIGVLTAETITTSFIF